ncbi:Ycf66 family protein, partial [Crocosphaera watsonii]
MLAYILAIAVGLASLSLYLSAFFLPELHRKDDFLWSGVGLFYALVLWVCAGRITGGVLLGQSASVTLVLCFGWQTLRLRRAIAHPDETTDITGFSFLVWLQNRFQKPSASPVVETPEETETTSESQTSAETETTDDDTEVISESQT